MAESNDYYRNTVERLSGGKDSIFEIGEITKFDQEKLTASVLGLRTKDVKENVVVTFPNFYMNSGILAFPINKTRGLLFVGPDNQNYFLPAQFHLPHMESEKGKAILDSSPERLDPYINFSDFEQGEFLFRHIKGTQLAFRNTGSVELKTDKANSITMDSESGNLMIVVDGMNKKIGYSTFKNTVSQDAVDQKARHTISAKVTDVGPKWKTNEIIWLKDAVTLLKEEEFNFPKPEVKTVFTFDLINVLDEDEEIIISEKVDSELFARLFIGMNDKQEYYEELTKSGNSYKEWKDEGISKTTEESLQSKTYEHKHRGAKKKIESNVRKEQITMINENGQKTEAELTPNSASVKITGSGNEKSVKIENNDITLKLGQTEIKMSNGDITFSTTRGKVSVNEIISAIKG